MPYYLDTTADNWSILYSSGIGNKPQATTNAAGYPAWYIDLSGDAEPHYITRSCPNALKDKIKNADSRFDVTMKIDGTDGATYQAVGNPGGGTPAITVMMRRGTDLTVAKNRMWCKTPRLTIREGEFTIQCAIRKGDWVNVDGQTPSSDDFKWMVANMSSIGVTFGGTFFGHGVKMASGSSRISMLVWEAW
jgi:hypothetical protein